MMEQFLATGVLHLLDIGAQTPFFYIFYQEKC
ncbi:hypothetical protein V6Z11_D05G141200 [Gossypium hirsutum]